MDLYQTTTDRDTAYDIVLFWLNDNFSENDKPFIEFHRDAFLRGYVVDAEGTQHNIDVRYGTLGRLSRRDWYVKLWGFQELSDYIQELVNVKDLKQAMRYAKLQTHLFRGRMLDGWEHRLRLQTMRITDEF